MSLPLIKPAHDVYKDYKAESRKGDENNLAQGNKMIGSTLTKLHSCN